MILFFCYNLGNSQVVPKLTTITTDDGLGFRFVYHVAQDKRGLIWISTEKGLERYDGYEFITFNDSKNADVKCAIGQSNKVIPGFMDDNTLLVWSNEKLFIIDLCDNHVSEFKIQSEYAGIIRDVYYAKDKKLYISVVKNDIHLFLQYENNSFLKLSEGKNKGYPLNQIDVDHNGNIWMSNMDFTIEKYDKNGNILFQTKLDSFVWFGSKMYFNKIFIDTVEHDVYLFSKSRYDIRLFNEKTKTYDTIISNLPFPVYNAVKDDQGNIWFATKKQLLKYNKKNKETPFQDYSFIINEALQFTDIKHLFIDREKVLWVSTNNGIIKLPLNKQLFDKVLYDENNLWGNEMRGITNTGKDYNFAFCENGQPGLYMINKKTLEPTLFFDQGYLPVAMDGVKHLCYDKCRDEIWILGKFLYRIEVKAKKIEKIIIDNFKYTSSKYRSPIAFLNDGRLIFGYHLSDIGVFNTEDQKITKLVINKSNTEEIATNFFQEDKDGNIWIGTNFGLFVINKSGEIIMELHESTPLSLSNNNCLSILIDSYDRKWIGTFGGGINVLEKSKKGNHTIRVIDKKSGLCDDNITALLEDDHKNLWASTYNGISKIKSDLTTIQNFYVEDGLTNNEFNYVSSMKDDDGKLWFGGLNGITIIDPNKDLEQQSNPPLVLTSFSSYDRRTNEVVNVFKDLEKNSQFVISPFTSWFQFNWALPNYYNSAKNKYYVWLEGVDHDYSFHGNNPFIRYNNLPHGEYVLHVKATDSKGNPSLGEIAVQIVVLPFFYQTWWFSILGCLILCALFYVFYKYNLNKKLAMERMRTQIASDLHDEVGSMLSGLAMQSELLQSEPNSPNFSKFENIANLSRNVVGKMRDLVWSIDSRSDTISDLVDKMHETMATLLGPKDIAYKLDIRDLPMDKTIPVITRQQLFLIFNEAITNVIRHSNASEVLVSIRNTKTNFEMIIKDNGTTAAQPLVKSVGYGLRNMHMRAAKIKANIEINTINGYMVKLTMGKM
jgi:ligand-binding sensor domain-containing protein